MTNHPLVPSDTIASRKPRIVHSEARWRQLVAQYESGSLTQKIFCQQHQISIGSLHKWRKRFKQIEGMNDFIEISQTIIPTTPSLPPDMEQNNSDWQVELELGQGMVLRVRKV